MNYSYSSGMSFRIINNYIASFEFGVEGSGRKTGTINISSDAPDGFSLYSADAGIRHFVIRYDATNKKFEFIVNGSQNYVSVTHSETDMFNPTVSSVSIGKWATNFHENDIANMEIYDIKLYSKYLTDEEILQNFNNINRGGIINV